MEDQVIDNSMAFNWFSMPTHLIKLCVASLAAKKTGRRSVIVSVAKTF